MSGLRSKSRVWIWLAAVLAAGLTARLGWWQLDRAAQKQALQAALQSRAAQPPLPAADLVPAGADPQQAEAQWHRRIRVEGRWKPQATVFLDNRPMAGRTGFYVVTPLLLDDGQAVLVQRGWVPRNFQDRTALPEVPTPGGRVHIEGRVAPPPGRLFDFGAEEQGRIRQNLDVSAYAREIGVLLRPVSIRQDGPAADPAALPQAATAASGPGPDGLLREWPSPDAGVAKHHGYAFQWFALSALIVGLTLWFQLIRPRRRNAHGRA